jgi:hypothetical protein
MLRQAGIGPANGNGNSSRPAERTAAAHNFQAPNFQNACFILRRVYRIRRRGAASEPRAFSQRSAPRKENRRLRLRFEVAPSPEKTANKSKKGYNLPMLFAVFAMRLLEIMFFVGLAGSAVVVLISFFEDGKELIGKDEPPEPRA